MIFLLSGFIAGVCGGTEMMGAFGKFRPAFATNLGWDGVMIASIARNNPIAVIFISFIWGALKSGSFHMGARHFDQPPCDLGFAGVVRVAGRNRLRGARQVVWRTAPAKVLRRQEKEVR